MIRGLQKNSWNFLQKKKNHETFHKKKKSWNFSQKKKNVFAPDFFQPVSTYTEVHNPHFLKAHEKQRTDPKTVSFVYFSRFGDWRTWRSYVYFCLYASENLIEKKNTKSDFWLYVFGRTKMVLDKVLIFNNFFLLFRKENS